MCDLIQRLPLIKTELFQKVSFSYSTYYLKVDLTLPICICVVIIQVH